MFRHTGNVRRFKHDSALAFFLSFVAGTVNITGLLSLNILTTNVTGHFANYAESLYYLDYTRAAMFLLFIIIFLAGAFVSTFLLEAGMHRGFKLPYLPALSVEIILLAIAGSHFFFPNHSKVILASTLLFAMGLQNALVTRVSKSVIRTTHMTGLFTDMGIELAQLFFYKAEGQRQKLTRSIGLRLIIVLSFLAGCIAGGAIYQVWQLKTLWIAVAILVGISIYDSFSVWTDREFATEEEVQD